MNIAVSSGNDSQIAEALAHHPRTKLPFALAKCRSNKYVWTRTLGGPRIL